MPFAVITAATLQLLLAAAFVVLPVTAWVRGGAAQRAAEAEVVRQGHRAKVLSEHGIKFEEQAWELVLALAIAAALTALGLLNLAGNPTGRVLSWIAEPVVLLAVGFVTASQVFAARYTEAALRKSDDPAVRSIDVRAVLAAATAEFPWWLRSLVLARFALVTAGSIAVIILLTTAAASSYFR